MNMFGRGKSLTLLCFTLLIAQAALFRASAEAERNGEGNPIVAEKFEATASHAQSPLINSHVLSRASGIISELRLQCELLETEETIIALQAQRTALPSVATDTTASSPGKDSGTLDLDPDEVWSALAQPQKIHTPQSWDNVRRDLVSRTASIRSMTKSLCLLEQDIKDLEMRITASIPSRSALTSSAAGSKTFLTDLWHQNLEAMKQSTNNLQQILEQDAMDGRGIVGEARKIRFYSGNLNSIAKNLSQEIGPTGN